VSFPLRPLGLDPVKTVSDLLSEVWGGKVVPTGKARLVLLGGVLEPHRARREHERLRKLAWERAHKGRQAKWVAENHERFRETQNAYRRRNAERLKPIHAARARERYQRMKDGESGH
jgi:hypothetical protein